MRLMRPRASRRHPASVWGQRLVLVILLVWLSAEWVGFVRALLWLTAAGFVAAIAGLRQPVLGLLGIGVLVVLDPISRHLVLGSGGLLRWNSFNYWLLIVSAVYLPSIWYLSDPHSRALRVLVVVLLAGLPFASRWEPGLQTLLNLSTAFAIVICFRRTPRDVETMVWLGVVMSVTAAVGGLAYYRQVALLEPMNKNAFAMFPLAGIFGACLALPFAAGVRGGQLVLASLAAVDLTWVFLSRSRGSLIVAATAMAFLIVSIRTLPRRVTYVAAMALVVTAISGGFEGLQADAASRFRKLFDQEASLADRTSGRANLALGGWTLFVQAPFGVGTGGFEDAWAARDQPDSALRFAVGKQVPAHSAWVMVLAENGVPGILILAIYVASFAIAGMRRRDPTLVRLGLFTTVILAMAFWITEFQGKALWFVAAGATALLHRQPSRIRSPLAAVRMVRMRPLVTPRPPDAAAAPASVSSHG